MEQEQALPERYWSTEEQRWIYPGEVPPMPKPEWRQMRETITPTPAYEWYTADQMQAYARAAVAQERERCAKECEALNSSGENSDQWTVTRDMAFRACAAAIRKG